MVIFFLFVSSHKPLLSIHYPSCELMVVVVVGWGGERDSEGLKASL